MNIELLISSGDGSKMYSPPVEEGIEWTTGWQGTPGKLTFSVLLGSSLDIEEGAAVRLKVDGKPVFLGYVFSKRQDRDKLLEITAYDQLRYLKNKDTYVYENKTTSQLVQMIAEDFSLKTGELQDTRYVIASRVEENTSLFDMIENALDITLQNTGKTYVLYDDFGKLTLKNIESMRVQENGRYLMIDESSGENYEYTSNIDNDTYNKIKLTYEDSKTGGRQVYIAEDKANMNKWGILQYFDTLKKGENGQAKAESLLKQYNAKRKSLKISNAFGDVRVRAGSLVLVNLSLQDMKVKTFMLVEKAKHIFKLDSHFMELTLRGGEFNE